jgi:hypothetical protein
MSTRPIVQAVLVSLGILFSQLIAPKNAACQAWLSPKGEGTVSFLYQYGFDRYHVFSRGEREDAGHISLGALVAEFDYSLTNRLAVRAAVPYINGKYDGQYPHEFVRGRPETAVALDNGKYHGALQDFRLDVRYNVSRRALMLTPFFQTIVPSHDYPYFGHPAVGTRQREYRMGASLGRRLNPVLPRAYVQGRYAFGVAQRVANIAPKRSYAEFQLGYFLTPRLSVQGSAVWTHTHNGIDFLYGVFPDNLTDEQWLNHDRISRGKLLDLGGGLAYRLNPSTNVFFAMGHSLYGANGHLRSVVVTVGITKSFTSRFAGEKRSARALLTQPSQALVCTCAKSN